MSKMVFCREFHMLSQIRKFFSWKPMDVINDILQIRTWNLESKLGFLAQPQANCGRIKIGTLFHLLLSPVIYQ